MSPQQFLQLLKQYSREIEHARQRTLPIKVGRITKDHFQDNFRQGGFVDGGLHPWQRTHRQQYAHGAGKQYKPLMSSRQILYGSIAYAPTDAAVTVGTSVPYADIHNSGGDIVVTKRMKRFFWAKFREENGDSWARKHKNSEADFWYRMAQKPVGSTIHIPQRQFIGESRELDKKIEQAIDKEIEDIISK